MSDGSEAVAVAEGQPDDGWKGDFFRSAVFARQLSAFFADRDRWRSASGRHQYELGWEIAEAEVAAISTALAWKPDPQRWFEVAAMLRHFADLVEDDGLRSLSWGRWGDLDESKVVGGPNRRWSEAQMLYWLSGTKAGKLLPQVFAETERGWSEWIVEESISHAPPATLLVHLLYSAADIFLRDGGMSPVEIRKIAADAFGPWLDREAPNGSHQDADDVEPSVPPAVTAWRARRDHDG